MYMRAWMAVYSNVCVTRAHKIIWVSSTCWQFLDVPDWATYIEHHHHLAHIKRRKYYVYTINALMESAASLEHIEIHSPMCYVRWVRFYVQNVRIYAETPGFGTCSRNLR